MAGPATNAPPFHWKQIESADYRQYIENLRAVGCPEPIIRDIVAADLNQHYAPRFQAIWKPTKREYWQKPILQSPSPEELKKLAALDKEKSGLFQELLGVPLRQQQLIDALHLQVHGSEQQLLFLPPDRREAAMQALHDAGFDQTEADFAIAHPNEDSNQSLFDEKLKILQKALSAEELEEFRLRNSWTASMLRTELQYFDCTRGEFAALLELREQNAKGKYYGPDLLNRAAPTEQVRMLFGDERAAEFEKVTDLFYVNARTAVEALGLPRERTEEAWRIVRDTRATADRVANNAGFSVEERNRQVHDLRDVAEASLSALLGEKASRGLRRDLRNVLTVTAANIRP